MLTSMHDRQNGDRSRLDAVENSEREPTDLRPANIARPDRVETGIGTNAIPARFDLGEELQPKFALLEFVPEELSLQFELRPLTDA